MSWTDRLFGKKPDPAAGASMDQKAQDALRERIARAINRERKKAGLPPLEASEVPGVGGDAQARGELVKKGWEIMMGTAEAVMGEELAVYDPAVGKALISSGMCFGHAIALKYAPWFLTYAEEVSFSANVLAFAWHRAARVKAEEEGLAPEASEAKAAPKKPAPKPAAKKKGPGRPKGSKDKRPRVRRKPEEIATAPRPAGDLQKAAAKEAAERKAAAEAMDAEELV